MTTTRSKARDRFEHLVVEAVIRLTDMARDPKRASTDKDIDAASGRVFALVDLWAHYRARVIVGEVILEPAARKLRELDELVGRGLAGEGEGWQPFAMPVEQGAHAWAWHCDRCPAVWRCEVSSPDKPGQTIVSAVEALARIAGWDIRNDTSRAVLCPPCQTRARLTGGLPHG